MKSALGILVVGGLGIAGAVALSKGGSKGKPARSSTATTRCNAMIDKMVDLLIVEARGTADFDEDLFRQTFALQRPELVRQCLATRVSDDEYACVIAASTWATAERCRPPQRDR